MKKLWTILLLAVFPGVQSFAQENDPDLKKEEQFIRGDYNPELNDPVRIETQPVIRDTGTVKLPVVYQPVEARVPVSFQIDTIQAAVIRREPVEKIYRNFLKAGFGFYTTPLVEFSHGSGRNKIGRYGLFLRHLSSSGDLPDVGFAGMSENKIDLFGERFFPDHTLSGNFSYNRDVVHHYGMNRYDSSVLDSLVDLLPFVPLRQRYNQFDFSTTLKRSVLDTSALQYSGKLAYQRTGSLDATENGFFLNGDVFKYLDKERFGGALGAEIYQNQNPLDTGVSAVVRVEPEVQTRSKNWYIRAGLNLAFLFYPNDVGTVHFFPDAEVSFNVVDNIIVPYAGIKGGVERVSYRKLQEENPFVSGMQIPVNTIEKWNFFGGVKGALSSRTSFNTRVSYGDYQNMGFWVNNRNFQNSFLLVTDDVRLLTMHGEIGYNASEKLQLFGKADYYSYEMSRESHAWHKPSFTATVSGRYSLFNKIILTGDLYYIGERMAMDNTNLSNPLVWGEFPVVLDDLADFGLGLEYRYTNRLSGFLKFNNLLASRYYRWNGFPSQRFQIFGGVTLSF